MRYFAKYIRPSTCGCTTCQGPGHGPYWYEATYTKAKRKGGHSRVTWRYVGTTLTPEQAELAAIPYNWQARNRAQRKDKPSKWERRSNT